VEPEIGKLVSPDNGITFSTLPLERADLSITSCEALVARTGSMVLSARTGGRTTSVYAPVHVCIARTSQLVFDVKDALQLMKSKYPEGLPSQVSFATGPSRTADIEKTLVVGVHGPKEVYCFLLEDL
jgi:L-lactate dehydrogenase complex protein LldG